MTEETIRDMMGRHPFLRDLSPDLMDRIADLTTVARFAAGEALIAEGRSADRFFLILDGAVSLCIGPGQPRPKVIEVLRQGDVLGWSWLIPPYMWTFDSCAQTPVQALVIDAAALRQRMNADHGLAHALLGRMLPVMAARLRAARLEILACDPEAA